MYYTSSCIGISNVLQLSCSSAIFYTPRYIFDDSSRWKDASITEKDILHFIKNENAFSS